MMAKNKKHLSDIRFDPGFSIPPWIKNEAQNAIQDLKASSIFEPRGDEGGPYILTLFIQEGRLVFEMQDQAKKQALPGLVLSLKPYKRIIKDYFMMIESYNDAQKSGIHSKLEAIDMGRRGIHDEAGRLLQERLADKIKMDHETARRLFTLLCVLHAKEMKGLF